MFPPIVRVAGPAGRRLQLVDPGLQRLVDFPLPPKPFKAARGEVSEWFKEHAWKACMWVSCIEGSNPSLSAITRGKRQNNARKPRLRALFTCPSQLPT